MVHSHPSGGDEHVRLPPNSVWAIQALEMLKPMVLFPISTEEVIDPQMVIDSSTVRLLSAPLDNLDLCTCLDGHFANIIHHQVQLNIQLGGLSLLLGG